MRSRSVVTNALVHETIRTEKELTNIIVAIVDSLIKEYNGKVRLFAEWKAQPGMELERLAMIAELRIELNQIRKIKRAVCAILKQSTNKMIVASIELVDN